MNSTRILMPDRKMKLGDSPLLDLLYGKPCNLYFHPDEAADSDLILIPFYGRNRITPAVFQFLEQVEHEIPIIGLESLDAGDRDWPMITMELQLTSSIPADALLHTLSRFAARLQRGKVLTQLQQDYERRINEIEMMMEMGIEFAGTLSHHELYTRIINRSVAIIPAEFHFLMIFPDPDSTLAIVAASHGLSRSGKPLPPTRRFSLDSIRTLRNLNGPLHGSNPFPESIVLRNEVIRLERLVKSLMIAPVISKDRLLGFIEIGNSQSALGFSINDRNRIEVLTDFAAVAIENAYLYEKTEYLAQIDDLTQIQNFNSAKSYLDKLIQVNEAFCMLFLDLDGFKNVNRIYGHIKGNEALRQVSRTIREHLDAMDLACRFGGDEFMIVMPGKDIETAGKRGETLIRAIESDDMFPDITLSGSIGITAFPDDGTTIDALIYTADKAMYHAKALGRGNVIPYRDMKTANGDDDR